ATASDAALNLFLFIVMCRVEREKLTTICPQSPFSKCSPGGNSANFSRCSGRSGSEIACSSLNHFPRSTSLQRREQKGPVGPANQSPTRLQVGHLTFIATKNNTVGNAVQWWHGRLARANRKNPDRSGPDTVGIPLAISV